MYPSRVFFHPDYPISLDYRDPGQCCLDRMSSATGCARCCAERWPIVRRACPRDPEGWGRRPFVGWGRTAVCPLVLSPTSKDEQILFIKYVNHYLTSLHVKKNPHEFDFLVNVHSVLLKMIWM